MVIITHKSKLIISADETVAAVFLGLPVFIVVLFETAKGSPVLNTVANTTKTETTIEYMPNSSAGSVLDKNILKTKPSNLVKTENIVIIATALNKDLIISPLILFYMFITKRVKKFVIIKICSKNFFISIYIKKVIYGFRI